MANQSISAKSRSSGEVRVATSQPAPPAMEWDGLLGPSPTSGLVTERAELSLPPHSTSSQSLPPRPGPDEPVESSQPPQFPSAHAFAPCPVAKKRVELAVVSLTLHQTYQRPSTESLSPTRASGRRAELLLPPRSPSAESSSPTRASRRRAELSLLPRTLSTESLSHTRASRRRAELLLPPCSPSAESLSPTRA